MVWSVKATRSAGSRPEGTHTNHKVPNANSPVHYREETGWTNLYRLSVSMGNQQLPNKPGLTLTWGQPKTQGHNGLGQINRLVPLSYPHPPPHLGVGGGGGLLSLEKGTNCGPTILELWHS